MFMGKLLKQLCKILDIKTTPYHPQMDGLFECWQEISYRAMLKKATTDKRDWDTYVPFAIFAYRHIGRLHTPLQGFCPFS